MEDTQILYSLSKNRLEKHDCGKFSLSSANGLTTGSIEIKSSKRISTASMKDLAELYNLINRVELDLQDTIKIAFCSWYNEIGYKSYKNHTGYKILETFDIANLLLTPGNVVVVVLVGGCSINIPIGELEGR